MKSRRILVCSTQTPFVRGGAEALVEKFVWALRDSQHEADTILLPFQDWPPEALIRGATNWRLLDIDKLVPDPADAIIAVKFPSYLANHHRKIVWLFHGYRPAYDLQGTHFSGYPAERTDYYQLIQWIAEQDREALSGCGKLLAISNNVRNRLRKFLDLDAEVLYPPPPLQELYYTADYEPFIFCVQRLETRKRTDLLIRSATFLPKELTIKIAGTGPEEQNLRNLVQDLGLTERVQFLGRVSDQQLLESYARCRGVFYAPYDEDFGFSTSEAFLAKKPVITAEDSGGARELVDHQRNGWISTPEPRALAEGIIAVCSDVQTSQRMGEQGHRAIQPLNWKSLMRKWDDIFTEIGV